MASPTTPTHPPRRPRRTLRVRAWAFTITAGLLAVVWVGSMKVGVIVMVTPRFFFGCGEGCVGAMMHEHPFRRGYWNSIPSGVSPSIEGRVRSSLSVAWWPDWVLRKANGTTRSGPVIPLWPFVLLAGVPGIWLLVKTRRHTNPNLCPHCGYDKTGLPTPTSEHGPASPAPCPECGKGA